MQQYAVSFILLQGHSTCFRCLLHPSSGIHKTVITASGTGHNIRAGPYLATLDGGSCTNIMTCTGGCNYSFIYSC
jgi:hypothetical protein